MQKHGTNHQEHKKGNTTTWGEEQQKAFDKIKAYVAALITLSYPNLNTSFEFYTDANNLAMGRLVTQNYEKKCDLMFLQRKSILLPKMNC